jgi:SAM-dependent methyltransferase
MNLFQPIFPEKTFDLIICQGVLHHTSNPYLGFQSIAKLLKPGGYIIIGLYNWYGRLITDFRRMFFKITGDKFKLLDPRLRTKDRGIFKRDSWFNDQYKHPHESKHTIGEVLKWFDENNFSFINGIPKVKPFSPISIDEKLFKPNLRGNFYHHLFSQLGTIIPGYREGGLFIMIGRKDV